MSESKVLLLFEVLLLHLNDLDGWTETSGHYLRYMLQCTLTAEETHRKLLNGKETHMRVRVRVSVIKVCNTHQKCIILVLLV